MMFADLYRKVDYTNDKFYNYRDFNKLGKVSTYKSIADAIGNPKAVRAVGSALRKNPFAPEVPCHRVVASDLTIGGFSGSKDPNGKEIKKKIGMLKTEGVEVEINSQKGTNLNSSYTVRREYIHHCNHQELLS